MDYLAKNKTILLPYLSSIIFNFAFWVYGLGPIVFIGLVPLIAFFFRAEKEKVSVKRQVIHVWLAGVIFFLLLFQWMTQTEPVTWSPVQGTDSEIVKYSLYVVISLFYSLSWLLLALVVSHYHLFKRNVYEIVVVFSVLWIALEFARSFLFSIFMWEGNATIGPHWNFGNLAFGASASPAIFSGRLVGLFGLSVIVVFANFAIYLLTKKQFVKSFVLFVTVFAISLFGYALYIDSSQIDKIQVAALQIDAAKEDEYIESFNKNLHDNQKYDVVITPEYSKLFSTDKEDERKAILEKVTHDDTVLVTSENVLNQDKSTTNNLQYYNNQSEILAQYEKSFLIPAGEYLPTWPRALMKFAGHTELVNEFNDHNALDKGRNPEQPYVRKDGLVIGSLICSGIISPQLYQQASNNSNPGIISNSASLNVFANAYNYHEQTKQMARFHAVANNKPYVQSTRDGTSLIIDSDGHILAESDFKEGAQLISAAVSPNYIQTFFTKSGEFLLILSSIFLITWLIVYYPKKLK